MMLPVRTTVSYQAADRDYEAPREQRAAAELYKTTQAMVEAYLLCFLLVAWEYACVIYCQHFILLVM